MCNSPFWIMALTVCGWGAGRTHTFVTYDDADSVKADLEADFNLIAAAS